MLNMTNAAPPEVAGWQRNAGILGLIGLVLTALGAVVDTPQFYRSYLVAFTFWLGITLGCLAVVMIHNLAGGAWGAVIRRLCEAATRTLPYLGVFVLPFLFGMRYLYEWADPAHVAADPLLQHKSPYLNVPFFWVRAVVYLAIWVGLMYYLNKWSRQQDQSDDPRISQRLSALSAGGLLLFAVTATFGAFDWLMSLEPHWFSHIYGALLAMGGLLAAMAFIILVIALMSRREPMASIVSPKILSDLGSIMFGFLFIWAYFAFSQYLLMWYANLSEEIPWYIRRLTGGWQYVAIAIVVLSFALPFALLISQDIKRNWKTLAVVAGLLLVMRLVDLFWMVAPAFHAGQLTVHWLDIVAPLGLGGAWFFLFLRELQNRPILPLNDPKLPLPAVAGHGDEH